MFDPFVAFVARCFLRIEEKKKLRNAVLVGVCTCGCDLEKKRLVVDKKLPLHRVDMYAISKNTISEIAFSAARARIRSQKSRMHRCRYVVHSFPCRGTIERDRANLSQNCTKKKRVTMRSYSKLCRVEYPLGHVAGIKRTEFRVR